MSSDPSTPAGPGPASAPDSSARVRALVVAILLLVSIGLGEAAFSSFAIGRLEDEQRLAAVRLFVCAGALVALALLVELRLHRRLAALFLVVSALASLFLGLFGFLPAAPLLLVALVLIALPRR